MMYVDVLDKSSTEYTHYMKETSTGFFKEAVDVRLV